MAKKPAKKPTRKVKDLKARKVSPDTAKRVKGGLTGGFIGYVDGESTDKDHKGW